MHIRDLKLAIHQSSCRSMRTSTRAAANVMQFLANHSLIEPPMFFSGQNRARLEQLAEKTGHGSLVSAFLRAGISERDRSWLQDERHALVFLDELCRNIGPIKLSEANLISVVIRSINGSRPKCALQARMAESA